MVATALTLGVGLVMRGSQSVAVDPTPTSSMIEPATSDPLPVVGPTEVSVDSDEQLGTTPGSQILVAQGELDPQSPGFVADPGLDDTAGTALGYRFEDVGLNRAALTAVLARKFGIQGRPVRSADGVWAVRTQGSPLSQVRVEPGPMVAWAFESRPSTTSTTDASTGAAPTGAAQTGAAQTGAAQTGAAQTGAAQTGAGQTSPPDLAEIAPTAEAMTRAFLGDLGVPLDELDWQVEVIDGSTVVTGWQVIADQRTSAGWQVVYDAAGQISKATGFAATPVEVEDLPVLGARSALDRASQPRWSALGPTLLTPAMPLSSAAASPSPAPGSPAPRVIVAADLTLAQFTQPDGRLLALPTYVLTAEDGSTWSLVAVADQALRLLPR